MYFVNKNITNNVHGYRLIKIEKDKVYVQKDKIKIAIELYETKNKKNTFAPTDSKKIKKVIVSRSVLQQKLRSLDVALDGLVAGPYKRNKKIAGYRLKRVYSRNFLHAYGLRSGDIIKRVNGHALNATGKLYRLYQGLKNEKSIFIDYIRRGKLKRLEFKITD